MNIVKYVPKAVSLKVGRQALLLKKNSPAIMFGAGLTIGVFAAVKACQATLSLEEVVDRHDDAKKTLRQRHLDTPTAYPLKDLNADERLVKVHLARDLTKLYAPSVTLGLVSVGLLTGAHVTLTKRNLALAAAYSGLNKIFNDYRDRVRQELGDDKDREFRFGVKRSEVVEEGEHGHEVKTVKRVGVNGGKSEYARLFDSNNKNWEPFPEHNRTFLQVQQTFANHRLQVRGHVFLNEIYEALGMEHSQAGAVVGWVLDGKNKDGEQVGDGYIDFGFLNPQTQEMFDFMRGDEGSVWLDFNVDGVVFDLLDN